MWRPSQPQRPPDASAYDYNTRYNLQATEDSEDTRQGEGGVEKTRYPARPGKRPNYRPTPLKWPFVACVAAIIAILIGLVVLARQRMPNSDNSAQITMERRVVEVRLLKRQEIVDDQGVAEIEALGTPIITLSPEPTLTAAALASLSTAKQTQTDLPANLLGGLERPGEIVLDVPLNPCGGADVCTTKITTDVISQTIIQPPELSESTVTLGSTTKVGTTKITETLVVGGTPVFETGTTVFLTTIDVVVPFVTEVEVDVTDVPSADPGEGGEVPDSDDGNGGSDNDDAVSEPPSSIPSTTPTSTTTTTSTDGSLFRLPRPPSSSDGAGLTPLYPAPGGNMTFGNGTGIGTGTAPSSAPASTTILYYSTTQAEDSPLEDSPSEEFPPEEFPPEEFPPMFTTIPVSGDIASDIEEPTSGTGGAQEDDGDDQLPPPPPPPPTLMPPKPKPPAPPNAIPTKSRSKSFSTGFSTIQVTSEVTQVTTKTRAEGGSTVLHTSVETTTDVLPVTDKVTVTNDVKTYFSLGETTIDVTYSPANVPAGQKVMPVTHFTTSVDPGETITGTIPGVPVAVVKTVDDVQTRVINLAPQTFVTRVGGGPTNIVITVTPSPGLSPGIFAGISMTVVSQVGGTFETLTFHDAPETIVTSIDGVGQTTFVRTPPPRVVTSLVGGTLSTFGLTTTPTATNLLSFTVVTTLEGQLTTFVSTPSPTTIVTTISGKLTTFTSTPSPSTFTSTIRPSSTRTIATIETPKPTADEGRVEKKVFSLNTAEYFLGRFLPALLAVLLAIVLRIIDLNAKLYQPFYALNQEGGAFGSDSMTLHYSGIRGFVVPFLTLFQGHPVPFITTMIVWASSLMVPLATEGLGLKLHGECKINIINGCAVDLGISPGPTHALLALMALVVMLLLVLIFFLRNWETGLYANPWSVAGITSLSRSRDVRIRSARKAVIRREMAEKRYSFGHFRNASGRDEYGIMLHDEAGRFLQGGDEDRDGPNLDLQSDSDDDFVYDADGSRRQRRRDSDGEAEPTRRRHVVPFIALSYPWRIAFILLLGCLFVLILYYHLTRTNVNDFTRFMNSQRFGVRFLFAGTGVIMTFAWVSFFVSVAIITPYHLMAITPQAAEKSILLSRPTHGIYGIYAGIKENNIFLLITAFMALLSEFLPLLLANIPYNLTQTERTHVVCARITLVIIGMMMATLLGSLFIRWPHMPVDPRSIAGAMYYISESRMRRNFEGISTLDGKERDRRVRMVPGRYYYGEVNLRGRIGVDIEDVVGEVEGRMVATGIGAGTETMVGSGIGMGTDAGTGTEMQIGTGTGTPIRPGTGMSPALGGNVNTAYMGHQI